MVNINSQNEFICIQKNCFYWIHKSPTNGIEITQVFFYEFMWSLLELRTSQTRVICHLFIAWCNINDASFNYFIWWLTRMIVRLLKVRFPLEYSILKVNSSWSKIHGLWSIDVEHGTSSVGRLVTLFQIYSHVIEARQGKSPNYDFSNYG